MPLQKNNRVESCFLRKRPFNKFWWLLVKEICEDIDIMFRAPLFYSTRWSESIITNNSSSRVCVNNIHFSIAFVEEFLRIFQWLVSSRVCFIINWAVCDDDLAFILRASLDLRRRQDDILKGAANNWLMALLYVVCNDSWTWFTEFNETIILRDVFICWFFLRYHGRLDKKAKIEQWTH